LPSLLSIFLNSNNIVYIEPDAFYYLPLLNKITLHNNKIKYLFKNTFRNLESLEEIHLNSNKINKIEQKTFRDLPRLEHLILEYQEPPLVYNSSFDNIIDNVPRVNIQSCLQPSVLPVPLPPQRPQPQLPLRPNQRYRTPIQRV